MDENRETHVLKKERKITYMFTPMDGDRRCIFLDRAYPADAWTTGDFESSDVRERLAVRRLPRSGLAATFAETFAHFPGNDAVDVGDPDVLGGNVVHNYLALKRMQFDGLQQGARAVCHRPQTNKLAAVFLAAALVKQDAARDPPEPVGVPSVHLLLGPVGRQRLELLAHWLDLDKPEGDSTASMNLLQLIHVLDFGARQRQCRRGGMKRCRADVSEWAAPSDDATATATAPDGSAPRYSFEMLDANTTIITDMSIFSVTRLPVVNQLDVKDLAYCRTLLNVVCGPLWGDTVLGVHEQEKRPNAVSRRVVELYKFVEQDIVSDWKTMLMDASADTPLVTHLSTVFLKGNGKTNYNRYRPWRSQHMEKFLEIIHDGGRRRMDSATRNPNQRAVRTYFRAIFGSTVFHLQDLVFTDVYRKASSLSSFGHVDMTMTGIAEVLHLLLKQLDLEEVNNLWKHLLSACDVFRTVLLEGDILLNVPSHLRHIHNATILKLTQDPEYIKQVTNNVRELVRIGKAHWNDETVLKRELDALRNSSRNITTPLPLPQESFKFSFNGQTETDYTDHVFGNDDLDGRISKPLRIMTSHILMDILRIMTTGDRKPVPEIPDNKVQLVQQSVQSMKAFCNCAPLVELYETILKDIVKDIPQATARGGTTVTGEYGWRTAEGTTHPLAEIFINYFLGPSPVVPSSNDAITKVTVVKEIVEKLNASINQSEEENGESLRLIEKLLDHLQTATGKSTANAGKKLVDAIELVMHWLLNHYMQIVGITAEEINEKNTLLMKISGVFNRLKRSAQKTKTRKSLETLQKVNLKELISDEDLRRHWTTFIEMLIDLDTNRA